MRRIEVSKRSNKYLATLPAKHLRQIAAKLDALALDAEPNDSKKLHGHSYLRADVGEHRIIYSFTDEAVCIALIGKCNDDDVYRRLDRLER